MISNRKQVPVDPRLLEDIVCDECGHSTFNPTVILRKLPALASPDGKDKIVNSHTFKCAKCDHVNKEVIESLDVVLNITNIPKGPQNE